jgi:flagellar protein FliO/FliZ
LIHLSGDLGSPDRRQWISPLKPGAGAADEALMQRGRPRPLRRLAPVLGLLLAGCYPLPALGADPAFKRDTTPLSTNVSGGADGTHAAASAGSSGGAALRMLLGLAIVLALIFGIYKLLKRSAAKNDGTVRAHGDLQVVATTPLAQSRALHLVRVGDELVLVGSSEQGVTRIRVYSADEARRLGFDPYAAGPTFTPTTGPADRPGLGTSLVETLRKMTAR